MKLIIPLAALAVLAPVAAMAATEGGWVPFEPTHAAIADQLQATLALRCDGVSHVSSLQQVGDYWEGRAEADGKRTEIYLFDNGTLWVGRRSATPAKPIGRPAACEKGSRDIG